MSTNNKKLSYWQLISRFEKIEIPIIQRDYALGRDNEKTQKIRERFLKSLINAIEKNELLELDFVYGNVEGSVFQPITGQQHLTTLFLLHWYLACKKCQLSEVREQLKKFTYETRISSREFCNELVMSGVVMGPGDKTLSKVIKNASWFFLSWQKDPTIKAMLTMLDCIEKMLQGKDLDELLNRLISEESPIVFYFKELEGIGLTDDLYIKLNARGMQSNVLSTLKRDFIIQQKE